MNAVKKINLPSELFDDEEPSEAMKILLAEQEAKEVRKSKRKNQRKTVSSSSFERTKEEFERMLEDDDWDRCEARHLIAFFEQAHTICYGVEDASLDAQTRYKAVRTADAFVKREFSGNFVKTVAYFRWLWLRESGREKWRRENSVQGGHVTWYTAFSGKTLTEYRLFLARKRK